VYNRRYLHTLARKSLTTLQSNTTDPKILQASKYIRYSFGFDSSKTSVAKVVVDINITPQVSGVYTIYRSRIIMSRRYFKGNSSQANIYETVSHELAHLITYRLFGKADHGKNWKHIHRLMGGSGHPFARLDN
jgi:hypothetical protein